MKISTWFILIALFILAGCSDGNSTNNTPPVEWSEIPVVPGMDVYEGAEEYTLDTFSSALQQALGAESQQMSIRYYWLPETISWEDIKQFYEDALLEKVWLPEEGSAGLNTAVWQHNSGKQKLTITALPVAGSEGHILALILSGE